MRTWRTINQHSPGEVAVRGKKDGISIPIKKRLTSFPILSLQKYQPCKCVLVCEVEDVKQRGNQEPPNESTQRIDC